MFDRLGGTKAKESLKLDRGLAFEGLALYGLGALMIQAAVPVAVTVPVLLTLASASTYRWLEQRWEARSLV